MVTDKASRKDIEIFKSILKDKQLNAIHLMGYNMVNTVKLAVKNKSEAEISQFLSFIVDEWKIAKSEEDKSK